MKRSFALIAALLWLAACSDDDKPKTIPEKDLRAIFRETLLVDAYLSVTEDRSLADNDTLSFFRPALEKRGYTPEDLRYTVGRNAQRKSDVMSALMDDILKEFQHEKDILDRLHRRDRQWDSLALAYTTDTLLRRDSVLRMNAPGDSVRFRFTVPVKEEGTYKLAFRYRKDSSDRNDRYELFARLTPAGEGKPYEVRLPGYLFVQDRPTPYTYNRTFSPASVREAEFRVRAFNLKDRRSVRKPALELDSLLVTYVPPVEEARGRYFRYKTTIKSFEEIYHEQQKDSGALRDVVRPPLQKRDPDR